MTADGRNRSREKPRSSGMTGPVNPIITDGLQEGDLAPWHGQQAETPG
jgi:hypothetical protein